MGMQNNARQKSEVDRSKVVESDGKIEELRLKVQLLADESQKVARLQAKRIGQDVKLTYMSVAASRSTKEFGTMFQDHASLRSKLDALPAAERRREDVLRECLERLCTGYSGLMRMHATSYRNRLNALLAVEQSKGEYAGGYRIRVGEDGYSPCIDEATSGELRRDCPSSQNDDDDDVVEVVVPSSNPLSSAP